MNFVNETTNDTYPKTLLIHNTKGGMIWQVYHVEKESEAEKLSINASKNGFMHRRLVDHQPETKQTWEDWRENSIGIID